MTAMLKDWTIISKLSVVSYPTLIPNGAEDEVLDSCVALLFYGITWHFGRTRPSTSRSSATFSLTRGLEGKVDAQGMAARWFGKP